jgi:O-acetyl-ADP-ribose deacetylase
MIYYSTKSILDLNASIVNAANQQLKAGGGVCGVIHNAAGPWLAIECNEIIKYRKKNVPVGGCVVTSGWNLGVPIYHAVGPIFNSYDKGSASKLLSKAYMSVMDKFNEKRIAFPAISCGIYGFPIFEACKVAVTTLRYWEIQNPLKSNNQIILTAFAPNVKDAYVELGLPEYI